MKEWTKEKRYALAVRLDRILGADLTADEQYDLQTAIEIISPEFAKEKEDADREAADFFENASKDDIQRMVDETISGLPQHRKDVPFLRFGEEKKQ